MTHPQRTILVNLQTPNLIYSKKQLFHFIHTLDTLKNYPIPQGELHLVFMDDPAIAQIHQRFLKDPTPTDVITFPGDPSMDFAGEIFISVDHALSAAKHYNVPFHQELSLYIIHGLLHLAGYNDLTEKERQTMQTAESSLMQVVEKARAFPNFQLS